MSDTIKYKDYTATVHFSNEDDVFYGKVVGVNDLISFEGDSVKSLKKAFAEAVDDYLELCEELNKAPEKTYKGSFNVRVPSDIHRKAAYIAAKKNISLNDFVKTALLYTIKHEKDIDSELKAG